VPLSFYVVGLQALFISCVCDQCCPAVLIICVRLLYVARPPGNGRGPGNGELKDAHGLGKSRGLGDGGLGDIHFCADADNVVEPDDVGGTHADAAEARRGADAGFLGRAVNVYVAAVGVAVARFEAFEPEDSGNDGVAARSIGEEDFAGLALVLEDGAGGSMATNLSSDLEFAERGAATAGSIAETEPGGGYPILGNGAIILEDEHALVRDANDDAVSDILFGATGKEDEKCEGKQEAAGRRHETPGKLAEETEVARAVGMRLAVHRGKIEYVSRAGCGEFSS